MTPVFRRWRRQKKLKTVEYLREQGYNVIRVKNLFSDEFYKGINTVIESKGDYKFELHFHTPSSIEAKHKNHSLYKETQMPNTTEDRKKDIRLEMKKNVSKVNIPPDIVDIEDIL